jgi:hypothetical protein
MNHKQKELLEEVISDLRQYYSNFNARILSEEGDTIRISVEMPQDEDKNWELSGHLAEKLTKILVDYGYYFWVLPSR